MKNLILLAPPASGKGTQASLLKTKYNLLHISTGDLLRNAASRNDDISVELNKIMSSGALVSDEIVLELLKKELVNNKNSNGFIFDGFPRNINQAIKLDELFSNLDMKIDYVFLLNADYQILLDRITGRMSCPNCKEIYNLNNNTRPINDNICNKCGSILIKRSDDNEDSFKIRYQEYLDKTLPLIDYYKEKGVLINIDANKDIDDIQSEISSIMEMSKW